MRLTLSIASVGVCLFLGVLPVAAQEKPRLNVVTTLQFLGELAREIGGDRAQVVSLASPRQDPHYVRARPSLMKACRGADLFIEVGLGLELWSEQVINGSGNAKIGAGQRGRVLAGLGIRPLQVPAEVSREYGDVHPFGNPHVWLDPLNMKRMASNITDGFARIDPTHREEYLARLAAYEKRIDEALFGTELLELVGGRKLEREARRGRLDRYLERKELTDKLGGWLARSRPLRGRPIVTYHQTWIYFANRFGFTVTLEIEDRPGIVPTARHRDRVVEEVKARGVKTLLVSSFYDRKPSEYISRLTGAKVVSVPIDVGASPEAPGYFELVTHILEALLASEARGAD